MPPHAESLVFFTYKMPFGSVTIASNGAHVTGVALGAQDWKGRREPDALTNACANQIVEYLSGKRTVFDLPLHHGGSAFQGEVWEAVCGIPYSQTRTNREIATSLGRPSSYRMVGAAVRQNPLAIVVPTHRVVPASGRASATDARARLEAALRELEQRYA